MSKLLEDPKVAALVEKQVAAAVKAETKRILELVKAGKAEFDEVEDKVMKKTVANFAKDLTAAIKAA